MMRPMADLFAGLGGGTHGARLAGYTPTFAANHNPLACEYYAINHGIKVECQDVETMDMRLLPDLADGLLVAGFVCKGHSEAGQPARAGSGGSHAPNPIDVGNRHARHRATAWYVTDAAELARPSRIIVENVPGFRNWALFNRWRGGFEDLGYRVTDGVLNAADFGSCQDRDRYILLASLDTQPIMPTKGMFGPAGAVGDVLLDDSDPRCRWTEIESKSERMRWRMRKAQNEAGSRCLWNNVSEASGRPLEGLAPTLTTKSASQLYLLDGDRGRILHARELARIQGLPDTYEIPRVQEAAGVLIGNAIDSHMGAAAALAVAA